MSFGSGFNFLLLLLLTHCENRCNPSGLRAGSNRMIVFLIKIERILIHLQLNNTLTKQQRLSHLLHFHELKNPDILLQVFFLNHNHNLHLWHYMILTYLINVFMIFFEVIVSNIKVYFQSKSSIFNFNSISTLARACIYCTSLSCEI